MSEPTTLLRPLVPMTVQVAVEPQFLERLTALRQTLAPTLTDTELELFGLIAQRKGLDPFSGQIMAVKRNTNRGARVTFQTGIDGYRSLAERTEQYLGSDEPVFGDPCDCGHPASYHPTWARVIVHRLHPSGRVIDQPAKAQWHEFVPAEDFMWIAKPEVMLGKVAEAQALRKAFPWTLGDLFIPEEMARGDDSTPPAVVSARETVAAKAAELRETTSDDPGAVEEEARESEEEPTSETAPGPSDEAPGATPPPLTSAEFGKRVKAAGVSKEAVKAAALVLFPDTPAALLGDDQWGVLWSEIERRRA